MTLFDLDPYGGELPPRRRADDRAARASVVVEDLVEGWVLVRGRNAVKPFFHRIVAVNPESGVLTACGEGGTVVDTSGVTRMVRCPVCADEEAV